MSKKNYRGGLYMTVKGNLLEVQETWEGYDFTLSDKDSEVIDGGVLEGDEWLAEEFVLYEALALIDHEDEFVGIERWIAW